MTTFLFSQPILDTSVSENSHTPNFDTVNVTSPQSSAPVSEKELKLANEVLQMAELQHNVSTAMLIRQTVSSQYKKVSQEVSPEAIRPKFRKKSLQGMMQQSLLHGAYWMGTNFIA